MFVFVLWRYRYGSSTHSELDPWHALEAKYRRFEDLRLADGRRTIRAGQGKIGRPSIISHLCDVC